MPEGDSIWRAAVKIRPVIDGRVLTSVWCRWPRIVEGLEGRTVDRIETIGKHLLIHVGTDILRIHLKMTGSWSVYDSQPAISGAHGLMLATRAGAVVCSHVPDVERCDARSIANHTILSRLGPDVIVDGFDPEVAVSRTTPTMLAGEVLLDQNVACGIGNIYRCEVLFLEKVAPTTTLAEIEKPVRLWIRAARLMRANLRPGRRNTTGQMRPEHWVYGRHGKPCIRCGSAIQAERGGDRERIAWWCPYCQPHKGY